ncbi:hypothetical protein C0Q44_02495 [Paenibacillus sp. PCH8]|uniref:hypothetical protein n=1 Tax=Paenibacillus sp. PCH8 TaxID=2066524 RepID=UPI000CF9D142|nr:hypothetical protein [Paenibacillus sp. PCH8]PQP83581.1 hypothetical protein C0Q44_02495 [Paenibacillus sp. PCH8]
MFIELGYGTRYRIGEQEYEIRKLKNDYDYEVYNMTYDMTELVSFEQLSIAYHELDETKRLRFQSDGTDHLKEAARWDLELYTSEEKEEMSRKFAIIEPFLLGSIKDVKDYVTNYPQELLPHRLTKLQISTFYRWIQKYKRHGNKICLVSKRSGPQKRRINNEELELLRTFIFNSDKMAEKKTIRDKWIFYQDEIKNNNLFREEKDRFTEMKESTFRRAFKEIHDPYIRDMQIKGLAQANLHKNGVRGALIAERPLQYVELDWTPLDYIIVDFHTGETFRPVVMYAADKCTDMPLGHLIIFREQPNAGDWKQLLLQIMSPKVYLRELYPRVKGVWSGYGKPENIIMDNAAVNDCAEVAEICGAINIGLIYNEKASGHQKGTIENALGKINRIFHAYPGTTFSNNAERGQYNSAKKACVNINGLHEMIHIVLVDLVANKYNRGVGGIPEDLWHEGLKAAKVQRQLPQNREYIELLFASESDNRTLGPKGIELKGQFYFSEMVNELRLRIKNEGGNRRVRIRYGIDVRHIYIYDEFEKRYLKADLKQTSRLIRYQVDLRYPFHLEHLSELCNKNNRDDYAHIHNQENVVHALKVLEEITHEGKKEYSKIRRSQRKEENTQTSAVSAVYGVDNKASSVPEDPNIILINTEVTESISEIEISNFDVELGDKAEDPFEISEIIASESVDLHQINSNWGIGRKSK